MARSALWFFQRTNPGEIRRISNPSMQRFLVGERALAPDGDGFVRCIGMSLNVHRSKPTTVSRVWFSKIRVSNDGKVDPQHKPDTHKLAKDEAHHIGRADSSVIVAGHRFAQRRLSNLGEWRPEQRDLDALRFLVNTKAGKEML